MNFGLSKLAKELLLWTAVAILICTVIGYVVGFPVIGFAVGCVLVVAVYALMRFIAWLFVAMVVGFFNSITGGGRRR